MFYRLHFWGKPSGVSCLGCQLTCAEAYRLARSQLTGLGNRYRLTYERRSIPARSGSGGMAAGERTEGGLPLVIQWIEIYTMSVT